MWIGHALGDLLEQWHLDLIELARVYHIEYLLDLAEKHHLLLAARLRPDLQQSHDHLLGKRGVLLKKLHNTICQLRRESI